MLLLTSDFTQTKGHKKCYCGSFSRYVAKYSNSWGFPINKSLSNWSGMVGMQMRGETDMSGLPALMDHDRNTVLSYVIFDAPSR